MNFSSDAGSGAGEFGTFAGQDVLLAQFSGRLQSILQAASANNEGVALMMVHAAGIDRLDAQRGFQAGSDLSGRVVGTLRANVLRKRDEIYPLSRNEYICILPGVASEGVAALAAKRTMSVLGDSPLGQGTRREAVDASVGIALFPSHGTDAASLLQHTKQALLVARERADRFSIYESRHSDFLSEHSQYVDRILSALDQNSLSLYYMPQIDLRSGRLTGAEALLRWDDAVLGPVAPNTAVQVAESSGLMDRMSQWIITSAVQQCARLQSLDPDFTVSVNISPSNLREPDLPLFVDRALRTWGVSGKNLIIEITETAMIDNQAAANEILHELKSYGLRLSIDDFGTGYSSVFYLARMPLDELKIDQSFVRGMLETPNDAKIVRSLIDLAHNLDLSVVAEGVEDQPTLAALAALGCDHAQGYLIGKAMPAPELEARLQLGLDSN